MKQIYVLAFLLFSTFSIGQEWEQVASLPDNFNTHHSFAFSIDGIGYMVGGSTLQGQTKSFYSYDPELDEWTKKDDFPGEARSFCIGDVWNGKAYFGFGTSAAGRMDDLWEYDPVTDAWTELATCDCDGRIHPAMVAVNGEIFVGMGGSTNGNANDWWAYNIEDNSWEERERFPGEPRHHPFQFTDGEYVYAGFGHGSGFISNQWYRYNTTNDTWLEVKQLPAEGRVAGTQMSYDGLGLILSGDGDDHGVMPTGEFWMYDPMFNSWTALTPHPGVSRWAPASFIINDEVYILNGERDGDHITENYKLDVSSLKRPSLNLVTSDDPITYIITEDNCNSVHMKSLEVGTRNVFDSDTEVTIEVDPNSSAVEGQDFILNSKSGTLLAGENTLTFELLLFDDAVVKEDRTLKLNLISDGEISNGTIEIDLFENDKEFGTESETRTVVIGEGGAQSIAPFARFYTNARSQMLYRSELLKDKGIEEGVIDQISFELVGVGGQGYDDFTVSLAHSNIGQFSNGPINNLSLQQVYQGDYTSQSGLNTIIFDTPFDYDGESNLIIQICFDNGGFSLDEFTVSTQVDYNSTVVLQADFVNGCPNTGELTSSNNLPNLFLNKEGFLPLANDINKRFQSEIEAGESLYFTSGDSIHAIVETESSFQSACFSSSLVTNSNEVKESADIDWIDRIYAMDISEEESSSYDITLLVPNLEGVDFDSDDISGLYSTVDPATGNDPAWSTVEVISSEDNPEYVAVKFPFQGNGYYAVGVGISTNTIEQELDLTYDLVTLYDTMGRMLASDQKQIAIADLPIGIYFLVYSNEGELVKTKKVIR